MSKLPAPLNNLPLPIIGSPLFIISNPKLVIAQCIAGVVGSMPALNARPAEQLEEWLIEITEALATWNKAHPDKPAAPFAINQIVHKSNDRLEHDMAMCVKYKVPIIITSLGAREDINAAAHSYGGVVLHDIINNKHARKAIEKGADGLIAVAAGAGGHAGVKSPFALIQEIRQWFDGPIALSGAISTGDAVLAAQAMGADFAYIGSAFIATEEARASDAYKQAIVDSNSDDIVYSNLFTGVHGNYLAPSIRNAGMDPDNLPESDPSKMNFAGDKSKAWKDIWGCGQGIGSVSKVQSTADFVARSNEYQAARTIAQVGRRPCSDWVASQARVIHCAARRPDRPAVHHIDRQVPEARCAAVPATDWHGVLSDCNCTTSALTSHFAMNTHCPAPLASVLPRVPGPVTGQDDHVAVARRAVVQDPPVVHAAGRQNDHGP